MIFSLILKLLLMLSEKNGELEIQEKQLEHLKKDFFHF